MVPVETELKYLLEVTYGESAIVSGWLGAFLIYHIVKVGAQRRIVYRVDWRRLPLSMQLAVAMFVISFGLLISMSTVWAVRFTGRDLSTSLAGSLIFIFGIAVALGGFMCALRVVTAPMIGPWPWRGALISSAVFLAWSALRLL